MAGYHSKLLITHKLVNRFRCRPT